MTKTNTELMAAAKEKLSDKWGFAIGTYFIVTLISVGVGTIGSIGNIASLIIGGPLAFGVSKLSLNIIKDAPVETNQIFDGFKDFTRTLVTFLWKTLYVFLWTLLLIVPGIIKSISYSMVFFILNDEPDIQPEEALKKSEELMDGHKLQYFYLSLIFFGYSLLCILTLGIGLLWLIPYIHVTNAKFYEEIKSDPLAEIGEA